MFPLFALAGIGLYVLLAPKLPKTQTVELVLGGAASKVVYARMAYTNVAAAWSSEVELNYLNGAPRVVHHETQMPDGDYDLAIDLRGKVGGAHFDRHVSLRGGATSVDVSEAAASALR